MFPNFDVLLTVHFSIFISVINGEGGVQGLGGETGGKETTGET